MRGEAKSPLTTFGRRRGRKLRAGAQGLVETLLPQLQLSLEAARKITARPLHLEIGFGGGEHLVAQARANPNIHYIGCEPYWNGIGNCLKLIEGSSTQLPQQLSNEQSDLSSEALAKEEAAVGASSPPQNIWLYPDDARPLMDALPEASVEKVYILFPDPWPKSRHHKRRLIQQPFLNALARIMPPGAQLLLATDHVDYLTWMLAQMAISPHFTWNARAHEDWKTPPAAWVKTGYQIWAESEGRASTYLQYTRV